MRHAYRTNRQEFTQSDAVKNLNDKLKENHNFDGKTISLNLRENEIDEWKNNMSISLDNVPLENSGYGTQNMFKSEVFLTQNTIVDILIVEEPENNLSYTNMSILISKLSENSKKQLFISTHSSNVANKMGLQNLHLVSDKNTISFTELKTETYDYFVKLPGYNTLRVLFANEAILVEGPADELIVQRAYKDYYGKYPIENGIDVKEIVENQNGCVLLISYTNEGIHSLEKEYRKQNDGILHEKVIIKSWYSFVLSEFIKPYQCLLNLKEKVYTKERDFNVPENFVSSIAFYSDEPPRWYGQRHIQYYINSAGDVYPDRTSEFACLCNSHADGKAISRIENIYSNIFIDELQDYAGWDLELIKLLFESKVSVTCVGDHKQATYRTNNSLKNRAYRDKKIRDFFAC